MLTQKIRVLIGKQLSECEGGASKQASERTSDKQARESIFVDDERKSTRELISDGNSIN